MPQIKPIKNVGTPLSLHSYLNACWARFTTFSPHFHHLSTTFPTHFHHIFNHISTTFSPHFHHLSTTFPPHFHSPDDEWVMLERATAGYSGSDLRCAVTDAGLIAVRELSSATYWKVKNNKWTPSSKDVSGAIHIDIDQLKPSQVQLLAIEWEIETGCIFISDFSLIFKAEREDDNWLIDLLLMENMNVVLLDGRIHIIFLDPALFVLCIFVTFSNWKLLLKGYIPWQLLLQGYIATSPYR